MLIFIDNMLLVILCHVLIWNLALLCNNTYEIYHCYVINRFANFRNIGLRMMPYLRNYYLILCYLYEIMLCVTCTMLYIEKKPTVTLMVQSNIYHYLFRWFNLYWKMEVTNCSGTSGKLHKLPTLHIGINHRWKHEISLTTIFMKKSQNFVSTRLWLFALYLREGNVFPIWNSHSKIHSLTSLKHKRYKYTSMYAQNYHKMISKL